MSLSCKDIELNSYLLVLVSGHRTQLQVPASCEQLGILLIEQKFLSECVCVLKIDSFRFLVLSE